MAYNSYGVPRFIDDLCTVNADGEFFFHTNKYIYLKQLELKLEHQGEHYFESSYEWLDVHKTERFCAQAILIID